jgi:hypothetical protein
MEGMKMNKIKIALIFCLFFVFTACAPISKQAKHDLNKEVNCATAPGDLRALESEKAHVGKEIADGVTAIIPISLVINVVTRTEGEHFKVASGEYNKMIDKKIAQIKQTCGIE